MSHAAGAEEVAARAASAAAAAAAGEKCGWGFDVRDMEELLGSPIGIDLDRLRREVTSPGACNVLRFLF